ncbi:MAG: beta-galactosidase, partial [Lentisphaerota bacterium]
MIKASEWQVQARKSDQVTLRDNDGTLEVSYKAVTDEQFRQGHILHQQAAARLLLKNPVALSPDDKRVIFEAKGLLPSSKTGNIVVLMPLIEDEHHEILAYMPQKLNHLKSGTTNWSTWMTTSFFSAEAGASQDVFTASGGDGNSWPDGKLTFIGFDLVLRDTKPVEREGKILIGSLEFAGIKLPYSDPFAYADAFLQKAGTYRLGAQILRRFQDAPVGEFVKTLEYNPEKPSLARQKIVFPLGSDDNYWIRYQINSADGEVVITDQMRYWVEDSPVISNSLPVDLKTVPSVGYMRLNPGNKTCGVYSPDESVKVTVRVFAKGEKQYLLKWKLTQYAFPKVLNSGEKALKFDQEISQDIPIDLQLPADRDAYKFLAELVKDGKVIDSQEYILGRKSDLSKEYTNRNGKRIPREQIKQSAYFRVTYLPYQNGKQIKFAGEEESVGRFSDALREIAQMTTNVTINMDSADFEILPDVFDFSLLDRMMDAAYDQNCRLTIRMSHADSGGLYKWKRYWPQRNFDGTINPGHPYYGSFSLADRGHVDSFLKAFNVLHSRYRNHPAFQGYQVLALAGEWSVLDQPWAGQIVTYEKCARKQFVEYVRKNITADLKELNRRWDTNYSDWDKVVQPLPTLENGARPDLRMQWIDFCKFKHDLDTKYWYRTVAKDIRSYDKDGVLISYCLDPDGFKDVSDLEGIDYFHNGGNHFLRGEGTLFNAAEKGIGWITEPHDPHRWASYGDKDNRGWVLDWSTFIMLSQAGRGGANLHVYYWPLPSKNDLFLPAHYGLKYAYDRFEKWKPILREMHGVQFAQPVSDIAAIQDIYTLFCKHRGVFQQRLDDLKRWFELMKFDAVDFEYYSKERSGKYKLIVPNILDEVMSDDNIKAVGDAVRNGAKTVICATTGRSCPERKGKDFALLDELGISAPHSAYIITQPDIKATVVNDNAFWGKGQTVDFYCLADMKRDIQGEEVKKAFGQWSYRWIPQTDYFGYFPDNKNTGGRE